MASQPPVPNTEPHPNAVGIEKRLLSMTWDEHEAYPGSHWTIRFLGLAVGGILLMGSFWVIGIVGVLLVALAGLTAIVIWLATSGADEATWAAWLGVGVVLTALATALLWYVILPACMAGILYILEFFWKDRESRPDEIRPAPDVSVRIRERYADDRPKIVEIRKPDAPEEAGFAYHVDDDGGIVCQTRMEGRVCQRVLPDERLGLHLERLTVEEFKNLAINDHWKWISRLPPIPCEAHGIEMLAYGCPDTPRPEFDYIFWLSYRIGTTDDEPGMRESFLTGTRASHPDWEFPAAARSPDKTEGEDGCPPAYRRPFVSKEMVIDHGTGRTVRWRGELICSRTALEIHGLH